MLSYPSEKCFQATEIFAYEVFEAVKGGNDNAQIFKRNLGYFLINWYSAFVDYKNDKMVFNI